MTIIITVEDESQRARILAWIERSLLQCPVPGVTYEASIPAKDIKADDLSLH